MIKICFSFLFWLILLKNLCGKKKCGATARAQQESKGKEWERVSFLMTGRIKNLLVKRRWCDSFNRILWKCMWLNYSLAGHIKCLKIEWSRFSGWQGNWFNCSLIRYNHCVWKVMWLRNRTKRFSTPVCWKIIMSVEDVRFQCRGLALQIFNSGPILEANHMAMASIYLFVKKWWNNYGRWYPST